MPGRLLNLVSRSSPPQSSASSIVEPAPASFVPPLPLPKKRVHNYRERRIDHPADHGCPSPERRLSMAMDHLLHLNGHRDKDREPVSKEKRQSLSLNSTKWNSSASHRTSNSRLSSPRLAPTIPTKMDVVMESPPLVFYGNTQNSTGALVSGRLRLSISDAEVTIQRCHMRLQAIITETKPVTKDCPECQSQKSVIEEWEFLSMPTNLPVGIHQYPFSVLLPGHLPATTRSSLGSIEYCLVARAVTSTGIEFKYNHPLKIQRSIIPGNDKASVRIFPPTNLTGRVVLPPVIHPIGAFQIQMTLSGIVERGKDNQTRWRLRKLTWRIEEHEKMVSPACARHCHKLGGPGKGIEHQKSRIIGTEELKSGWKTDWDTIGGEINMEFTAAINPANNPVCDMESPAGMEVTHNLVVELIVAEEYCPNKNTRLSTPTGAARVLRMQFKMFVTERPGLGISWDEEMPPVYDDVPASPPNYRSATMEDYGGPPLEYEELERMDRTSPVQSNEERGSSSSPHGVAPNIVTSLGRFDMNDLETAPVFNARRHDEPPADPEDVAQAGTN